MRLRPQKGQRPADMRGECVLPGAEHAPRRMRMLVHRRVDRVAQLDSAYDAAPVWERQRQDARVLVPLGAHPHHGPVALVVEEPAVLVDEPEAPVPANAAALEDDLLRMLEAERLDGGD